MGCIWNTISTGAGFCPSAAMHEVKCQLKNIGQDVIVESKYVSRDPVLTMSDIPCGHWIASFKG